ncbi:CD2 antigen cytoplasmic tail-binding protein 2 homolog [Scaptodrosophila lebanonensis]|uniref:CD2 antigen cytoplasmic tail-binding protein 2 homolog n=1 Tax=Drosophila lebanonensis TaxID=7225 RepID=A0A6J2UB12_DROLE|nr:CD2 antigen cytoplasmic tail-binding protein 2 homolog [Scaptodrosophila lebanonensis]
MHKNPTKRKYAAENVDVLEKKHTLDSDEEDSDDYQRDNLNDSDIEGGEDGDAKVEGDVKITPFNMREELQEGHFDTNGHYHWNKETQIKDSWLDNIDWVKVEDGKKLPNFSKEQDSTENELEIISFNKSIVFAKMLEYMKPGETVQMALQRLGKQRPKLSTVERLKRKKAGLIDIETQKISELTELANNILSKTGNMDIYQETYEQITDRLVDLPSTSKAPQDDMYADDFEEKEKIRLKAEKPLKKSEEDVKPNVVMWEFKWKQDDEELQGPFNTEKMFNWSQGNYFKSGVYVRKVGESNFYSSKRIDFDLYL